MIFRGKFWSSLARAGKELERFFGQPGHKLINPFGKSKNSLESAESKKDKTSWKKGKKGSYL